MADMVMKTKSWIKNEIRSRLADDEHMPPFTAIETLICEAIDRLARIQIRHSRIDIKPHETEVFDQRIKNP